LPHKDFSIPARPFDSIFDSKAKALVGMTDDEVAYVEAKGWKASVVPELSIIHHFANFCGSNAGALRSAMPNPRLFLFRPTPPPACLNHFKSIQRTDRMAVHTYSSQPSDQLGARRLSSEAYAKTGCGTSPLKCSGGDPAAYAEWIPCGTQFPSMMPTIDRSPTIM